MKTITYEPRHQLCDEEVEVQRRQALDPRELRVPLRFDTDLNDFDEMPPVVLFSEMKERRQC
jgi:hypothetical protein